MNLSYNYVNLKDKREYSGIVCAKDAWIDLESTAKKKKFKEYSFFLNLEIRYYLYINNRSEYFSIYYFTFLHFFIYVINISF